MSYLKSNQRLINRIKRIFIKRVFLLFSLVVFNLFSQFNISFAQERQIINNLNFNGFYIYWNNIDSIVPIEDFINHLSENGVELPSELDKTKGIHPNSSMYEAIRFFPNGYLIKRISSAYDKELEARMVQINKQDLQKYQVKNDSIFFDDGGDKDNNFRVIYTGQIAGDTIYFKRKMVYNEGVLNSEGNFVDSSGKIYFKPQFSDADSIKVYNFIRFTESAPK
jgi:hypothetical protein